jgi:hypothetical protein
MPFPGILHRVALVRIDVSDECSASVIRVTRIGDLGTLEANRKRHVVFLRIVFHLLVTANVVLSVPILLILMMKALDSSETRILARAIRCNNQENNILQIYIKLVLTQRFALKFFAKIFI